MPDSVSVHTIYEKLAGVCGVLTSPSSTVTVWYDGHKLLSNTTLSAASQSPDIALSNGATLEFFSYSVPKVKETKKTSKQKKAVDSGDVSASDGGASSSSVPAQKSEKRERARTGQSRRRLARPPTFFSLPASNST